jgi:hypothetical protein
MNNKIVRLSGNVYRIITANLWGKTLLSAECVYGNGPTINNLNVDRTKVGRAIKQAIKLGLVS